MPVLILAAASELAIVRALAERLRQDGGEVRCYLEEDDHELRDLGCKIAVGDLGDEMNLEAALTNVHTFIPVFSDPASIQDEAQASTVMALGKTWAAVAGDSKIEQTIAALPALMNAKSLLGECFLNIKSALVDAVDPLAILVTGLLQAPGSPLTHLAGDLVERLGAETDIDVTNLDELISSIAAADDREAIKGQWRIARRCQVGELEKDGEIASQASDLLVAALRSVPAAGD